MSALVGYDLTISVQASTNNHAIIGEKLHRIFKKFVFQKECTEAGYNHWQIRGHLHKATTLANVIKMFGPETWGGHWSQTSSTVHAGNNFNYVMKLDSAIEGPWKETDLMTEAPTLTRQLKSFMKHDLYPWQLQITTEIQEIDDRLIKVLIDSNANNGKSTMCEFLEYQGLAYEIPPMTCMEDIMQCCMCLPPQKAYLIDMPRGMKKEKLAGFYAGIEALKNGVMYDKRYGFKKRRIDRPQIWVFTNYIPDLHLLSKDRWRLYKMMADNSLSDITEKAFIDLNR